jgi:shikimate dehydrogenase
VKQVGLIGYPVSHSLSPQMQQAAFDALGIEARYVLWETQPGTLAQRIASLRSPGILGANVTIPYKEDVVSLLDEYDAAAVKIGAVNTIVNRDGRLVGYNTDAAGFIRALTDFTGCAFDCHGKKAVILGTGGAARAAAVALLENGVGELALLGRTHRRVDALVTHLRALDCDNSQAGAMAGEDSQAGGGTAGDHKGPPFPTPPPSPLRADDDVSKNPTWVHGAFMGSAEAGEFLSRADLLVNATPVGLRMDDEALPVDIDLLQAGTFVMDMVFNSPQTRLLGAAYARGCHTLNGLAMLLYQGALAFELWTGRAAPVEPMRAALGFITE